MRAVLLATLALGIACRSAPPADEVVDPPGRIDDPPVETDGLPAQDGRSLLLISVDGLRWDYLDRNDTPSFDRIGAGIRAKGLQSTFPSFTFPSHYTIVTGLHAENHGIVSNVFYDPERRDQFKLGAPEDMVDGSWWGGEPIWNTAEKQGIKAATLFWPGSEADIGGMHPSIYTTYDSGMSHDDRVNRVIGWLTEPAARRPGFTTLYFSSVDSAGHGHGPDSAQVDEAVRSIDRSLGKLLDGLQAGGVADMVDIIVVSDHGMAKKDPTQVVFTDEVLDLSKTHVVEWSPIFQAHGVDDPTGMATTLDGLDHVSCYTRETTPAAWHYRANRSIGDVVCLVDDGWQLSSRDYFEQNPGRFTGGTHGWNPAWEQMQGIFLANGPRLRDGVSLGVVQSVDLYGVMCATMGLDPAPNDGDPALIGQVVEAEVLAGD